MGYWKNLALELQQKEMAEKHDKLIQFYGLKYCSVVDYGNETFANLKDSINSQIKDKFSCHQLITDICLMARSPETEYDFDERTKEYVETNWIPEASFLVPDIPIIPKQNKKEILEYIKSELIEWYLEDNDNYFNVNNEVETWLNNNGCSYLSCNGWYEYDGDAEIFVDAKKTSDHQLIHHKKAIKKGAFFFDGYWFRTEHELALYEQLKKENVNVYVNKPVAVKPNKWYEVDFIVIDKNGKIGAIELNGNVHNGRSDYDHQKRREIMDKLLLNSFEFYSNESSAEFIVEDFLYRLNK